MGVPPPGIRWTALPLRLLAVASLTLDIIFAIIIDVRYGTSAGFYYAIFILWLIHNGADLHRLIRNKSRLPFGVSIFLDLIGIGAMFGALLLLQLRGYGGRTVTELGLDIAEGIHYCATRGKRKREKAAKRAARQARLAAQNQEAVKTS
ncbi:predicted protein [Uncinocarpus reesii 1704]|uniref:Uncharacterized protein n=1 Tax=Uncinocarpus reesii (strain UAMH 1704) TaxID=336963 RepID=C4JKG3_UNCRE|nr:uncharacterized protein UREG_02120 [Uncinocarpus reesii 1704]EEP77271.1 predicted protein [Uncinocarpus reesii 1704]